MFIESSSSVSTKMGKSQGSLKDIGKEIDICKKYVVTVGDKIELYIDTNAKLASAVANEKEYVTRLKEMIRGMKADIARLKKECDITKKNIQLSAKQSVLMNEKRQKMV